MTSARQRVEEAKRKLATAHVDLAEERRRRRILCHCGVLHPIGKLELLVTHWYTEPHGCTGGDYWNEGEWRFVCPKTGHVNRLMFDDYGLDWKERDSSKAGEVMFKVIYRGLFASSRDTYRDEDKVQLGVDCWNNYYVDSHRERFELPAKVARQ